MMCSHASYHPLSNAAPLGNVSLRTGVRTFLSFTTQAHLSMLHLLFHHYPTLARIFAPPPCCFLLTLSYVFVTFLFFTVDIPPPWCFTHALLAVLFRSLGLFYFYSSWRYSHRKSLTLVSYIAFARRCIHTSDGISTSIRYCYYMLVRFSIDKIGSLNVTASATHTSPSIAFRDFSPDQTS